MTDEIRKQVYQSVFNTELGRKVLEDLYSRARIGTGYFAPEPTVLAFNAGRADTVLYILNQTATTPPGEQ